MTFAALGLLIFAFVGFAVTSSKASSQANTEIRSLAHNQVLDLASHSQINSRLVNKVYKCIDHHDMTITMGDIQIGADLSPPAKKLVQYCLGEAHPQPAP